jgi:hemoglobin
MPKLERPSPEIYEAMGEQKIIQMMIDFYAHLERSSIRAMFPQDMEAAARKSALFFVFLLGGPPLYQQQIGQPMMRARHIPFPIDESARVEWVRCFRATLARAQELYTFPAEHLDGFIDFLEGFSRWMVNTSPDASSDPGGSLPIVPNS